MVLLLAGVGGVLLLGGDDEPEVVVSGDDDPSEGTAGLAEEMAAAASTPADGSTASADAMTGTLADAMTSAMDDPEPSAAQTEAVRPAPLGAMPEAPPEPPPFDPGAMPLPEQMTDVGGQGSPADNLRALAQPIAPNVDTPVQVAGDGVAVVSFTLAVGDRISMTAIGQQDPELIIVAPDDTVAGEDSDSGPGLTALANVVSAPVAGEYIAAVINNTGADDVVTLTLQTGFNEFEVLDIPDGTVPPGDVTVHPVEVFAGETLRVLIVGVTGDISAGIAEGGQIVAFSSPFTGNVQLVEHSPSVDGVLDVVAFGGDAGGEFVMYTTVRVG